MDHIIYTAMSGANRITEQEASITNNLANANTPGFREQLSVYRSVPIFDNVSLPTRVTTVATTPTSNFQLGAIHSTGRALDVAMNGKGWLAVQSSQGEAYTRNGDLQVGANGLLQTSQGQPVLSDQGAPINVPDQATLTITSDGSITALGAGDTPDSLITLGRLKLVNPPEKQLVRGDDGLFRMPPQANGQPAAALPADPALQVVSGALEGSNASPTAAMVGMIENSRRFEMQMQVISDAMTDADKANGILSAA